ncbi:FAD-binding oxidoreductase [Chryseobacterium scophthalmum]|uniref:FAD-binding oxidoreductase n=1 Tax=Chryseobacterium scophthalmum TaxID=59733 RepID=UPI003D08EFF5
MPTAPKWLNDALEKIAPSFIRIVKVEESVYLNPYVKKIRLKGNFTSLDFSPGFTISLRVTSRELRHYTVSYADDTKKAIEFVAYLHGNAVGANYINILQPDDQKIKLAVLGSDKQYDSKVEKQVVFGDETSLGLMLSFLPFLKKNNHQFMFYIELEEENISIPEEIGLCNYTVFPKKGVFRNIDDIQQLPLLGDPQWSDANIILTGNVNSIQNFRKALKLNNHKGKIYVKGYWLEGKKGL